MRNSVLPRLHRATATTSTLDPSVAALAAMQDVERAVRDGLTDGRQAARGEARKALGAEWAQVQSKVTAAGFPKPEAPTKMGRDSGIRAATAAKSYASAWGATAVTKADEWTRETAHQITDSVEARLDRIIATETSDAFQKERASFEAEVVKRHKTEKWFPALIKAWDARLDGGRCALCSRRSLGIRPWGVSFAGGNEPGTVHPNCRCVVVTVMLLIPYNSVDEAA